MDTPTELAITARAPRASTTEQRAIGRLLGHYFDGLYHGDIARLTDVFHPSAHYICATDGELLQLTMDEYFRRVAGRPSPASLSQPRADRILAIEQAGPVTALAIVNCAIGSKFFTDFLSLICLDGQWQIIAKVFHYRLQQA